MKGQKLFNEISGRPKQFVAVKKGRNDALLESRNCCLLDRYYYYSYFSNRCFEDIMAILVKEFFLSQISITRIVQNNVERLKVIKEQQLPVQELKAKWPHFKW